MTNRFLTATISAIFMATALLSSAQARFFSSARTADPIVTDTVEALVPDSLIHAPNGERWDEMDPTRAVGYALDTITPLPALPAYFFRPAVYDHFDFPQPVDLTEPIFSGKPEMRWIEEQAALVNSMNSMRYNLFFNYPGIARYNVTMLPEAPKVYQTVVNPDNHRIAIEEVPEINANKSLVAEEVKKRHWIRRFDGSVHFSQAYVSPNWYQGGNNNLNVLGNLYYNVKLNQVFHPNLLFDFTAQYKLGLNSAPDDSLRNYSISEDLLQLNSTFGFKAAKKWFYTVSAQFKTQLLNSYTSNTRNLRASFLAPGELTAGVGMTYNHANKKKTFSFNATMAPISYKMQICANSQLNETAYGIKEGHKTASKYGSNAELKLHWAMSYNITFDSRLYAFTDYSQAQADWENTLSFEINKFLTTKIFAHVRYDSNGVPAAGTNWKKLQVKEILSFGFAYKFSSL